MKDFFSVQFSIYISFSSDFSESGYGVSILFRELDGKEAYSRIPAKNKEDAQRMIRRMQGTIQTILLPPTDK